MTTGKAPFPRTLSPAVALAPPGASVRSRYPRSQWVGTAPTTRCVFLTECPRIGVKPRSRGGAKACLGGSALLAVGSSELHIQLHLLTSDVLAGHGGGLFLAVETCHAGIR